jgi:hypothetical protein
LPNKEDTQLAELITSVSKDILGDLQKRINKLKKELEDYRKNDISEHMIRKEQVAHFKLDRLEEQWDMYWRQRAHVQCSKKETGIQHTSTHVLWKGRRRTLSTNSRGRTVWWWKGRRV